MTTQSCDACGTQVESGTTACPSCGQAIFVDIANTPKKVPKLVRHRRTGSSRASAKDLGLSPEKAEGRNRMKAAKLCATSFYAGISAVVLFFIPFMREASIIGALIAVGAGIWGLVRMKQVGPGPVDINNVSPIERVAARMARRAPGQATLGIVIGVALIGFFVFALWAADRAERRNKERLQEFLDELELDGDLRREVEREMSGD